MVAVFREQAATGHAQKVAATTTNPTDNQPRPGLHLIFQPDTLDAPVASYTSLNIQDIAGIEYISFVECGGSLQMVPPTLPCPVHC